MEVGRAGNSFFSMEVEDKRDNRQMSFRKKMCLCFQIYSCLRILICLILQLFVKTFRLKYIHEERNNKMSIFLVRVKLYQIPFSIWSLVVSNKPKNKSH